MKKIILIWIIMVIPIFGIAQTLENLDYISPFNEGVAAIEKGNQWAFINKEGSIVVDFRDDLVNSNNENGKYPIFKDDRCLIEKEKEGISYFGYINKTGIVMIEPQFLNAMNFKNNMAIVLKLVKTKVGENNILGKNVVNYEYFEVSIDKSGNVIDYLTTEGVNITLDKNHLKKPLKITHKKISDGLYAVQSKNNSWSIKKIAD